MRDPRRYGIRLRDDRRYLISPRWDGVVESATVVAVCLAFLTIAVQVLKAVIR